MAMPGIPCAMRAPTAGRPSITLRTIAWVTSTAPVWRSVSDRSRSRPASSRNAHRLEVPRRRHAHLGQRRQLVRRHRLPSRRNGSISEKEPASGSRPVAPAAVDTGERADAIEHGVVEPRDGLGRGVPGVRQRDAERDDAVRSEPGIDRSRSFSKLRSTSPDPTSSTVAIATCATTSSLPQSATVPVDRRRPIAAPKHRRRSHRTVAGHRHDTERHGDDGGDERRAGERRPRRYECRQGEAASSGASLGSSATAPHAKRMPSTPPASSSIALSASDCASRCPRSAPNAMRSATSRRRVSARTSSRLATFTHAMSSTSPTIAQSVHSTGRTPPTTSSRYGCTSGTIRASRIVLTDRKSTSVVTRGSRAARSRAACSGVTPARNRPIPAC